MNESTRIILKALENIQINQVAIANGIKLRDSGVINLFSNSNEIRDLINPKESPSLQEKTKEALLESPNLWEQKDAKGDN